MTTDPDETTVDPDAAAAASAEQDSAPPTARRVARAVSKRAKKAATKEPKPARPAGSGSRGPVRGAANAGRPRKPEPMTAKELRAKLDETTGSIVALGTIGAAMRGDPRLTYDVEIIAAHRESIVAELMRLADRNPAVHRALVLLVTGSDWAQLISLIAAVGVPILVNHGALPRGLESLFGAPAPPERVERPAVVDVADNGLRVDA